MPSPFKPELVARRLQGLTDLRPKLAIVLGSGFGSVATKAKEGVDISYHRLSGYPASKVPGHDGRLHIGLIAKVPVMIMSGRVHYYEGHSMERITFPVRVAAEMGIETVLLTNAAGGISQNAMESRFLVIDDHINLIGENPLRGHSGPEGPPFLDLSELYDPKLRKQLRKCGKGLNVSSGVYCAVSGPTYETPAEIRAFESMGADAVGMSTVPEAIMAHHCGLRVAGISLITNPAAGKSRRGVQHSDVLQSGEEASKSASKLIKRFVSNYE